MQGVFSHYSQNNPYILTFHVLPREKRVGFEEWQLTQFMWSVLRPPEPQRRLPVYRNVGLPQRWTVNAAVARRLRADANHNNKPLGDKATEFVRRAPVPYRVSALTGASVSA